MPSVLPRGSLRGGAGPVLSHETISPCRAKVLFRGQNYAAFVQYMFAMRYKNIKKSFISCPLFPALQPRQSCPSVPCAWANPAQL